MSALVVIAVILLLILLNGFFVAAEFAIVAVPKHAIQHRAADGSGRAARVETILCDPRKQDRYVATAQLGITAASLGLGMYGEHILAGWFYTLLQAVDLPSWVGAHALGGVCAVGLLTYFHIVIGEMVPKAVALSKTERVVLLITPIMTLVQAALYPLITGLNGLSNLLLRVFGVKRTTASGEHLYSPEDLQYVVRESEAGGLLPAESAQVLEELLDFGDLTAREVMVPRVRIEGLRLGAPLEEILTLVHQEPHTRYPVHAGDLDHIVGMVHIKDILRRHHQGRTIGQADVRPIPFVPESMHLEDVFSTMRERQTQMVVVMDEHGGTDGIITIEDLFEEVVGDIDERGIEPPEIVVEAEGRLLVSGTVRLEEVGEELERILEHEEVDSVSGLVLELLGRPPQVGDRVDWEGLSFEVLEVEGHGATRVRIRGEPGR